MSTIVSYLLIKENKKDGLYNVNASGQGIGSRKGSQKVKKMAQRETIGHLIRGFPDWKRKSIVDDGLDLKQDLGPKSGIIKDVYRKLQYNFDRLICSLTRSICLGIIGYTIKELDS